MERVKKGEMYWSIYIIASSAAQVYQTEEKNSDDDNDNFKYGNYFISKEDALLTANKINKIFKGADVIEMPSEEKIEEEAYENNHIHKERGDCNYPDDLCIEYFIEGVKWLKSKLCIVQK